VCITEVHPLFEQGVKMGRGDSAFFIQGSYRIYPHIVGQDHNDVGFAFAFGGEGYFRRSGHNSGNNRLFQKISSCNHTISFLFQFCRTHFQFYRYILFLSSIDSAFNSVRFCLIDFPLPVEQRPPSRR
jgi:hypothetical protein